MKTEYIQVNEIVYVPGNYFDIEGESRWSEIVAQIDWKSQSLLGVVKSFEVKNHENYVNVLWLVDYRSSSVLQKDLKVFPKNLRPITGIVENFNIKVAEYVIVEMKKKKKKISIYGMSDRETRLSGSQVLIINNYEPKESKEVIVNYLK